MSEPAGYTQSVGPPFAVLMTGQFNRVLGWSMLILGIGGMIFSEPWIFASEDPAALIGSSQMQLRHAQGVLLAMALLQLVIGYVLNTNTFSGSFRSWASLLTGLAAITYTGGYVLLLLFSFGGTLVLLGSLLNLTVFAWALRREIGGIAATQIRLILVVLCFGMCLDLVSGLITVFPDVFHPAWLGSQDDVRLRMLRLARVAGIGLPVLTLLFFDLVDRTRATGRIVDLGQRGFVVGAMAMPSTLAMACFFFVEIKYLLTIPSTAVCVGSLVACVVSWKHGAWLEKFAWIVITLSLFGGMITGMYAFDGPFPAPESVAHYQVTARRLMRVGHAFAIVFGMLSLFIAQRLRAPQWGGPMNQIGVVFYLSGMALSLAMMAAFVFAGVPHWSLGIGPATMLIGLVCCASRSPSPAA